MIENEKEKQNGERDALIEEVRDYLCGYRLCLDMLRVKRYERRRQAVFRDECECADVLAGNEAFWRARMFGIETLIGSMKEGREKLILYYHYLRGESIERAADLLGVSRRTGYRMHQKGLLQISFLYAKMKEKQNLTEKSV